MSLTNSISPHSHSTYSTSAEDNWHQQNIYPAQNFFHCPRTKTIYTQQIYLARNLSSHLMKETNPVFEICLKNLKMVDNVDNNSHVNFNTPPSEIFRLSLKMKQFGMDWRSKTWEQMWPNCGSWVPCSSSEPLLRVTDKILVNSFFRNRLIIKSSVCKACT